MKELILMAIYLSSDLSKTVLAKYAGVTQVTLFFVFCDMLILMEFEIMSINMHYAELPIPEKNIEG